MAIKQIQKNRLNESGEFDVIHYETDASITYMSDGTNVEDAINNVQSKLTFDNVPTENSENPVTSGGVYNAIPTKTSDLDNDSGFITGYTETDPTVPAWAKADTKPTYTAQEVGALPDTTEIPSALSELSEDATHRTVTDSEKTSWAAKADKPKSTAVTLTAAGWVSTTAGGIGEETASGQTGSAQQTVTVSGVSSDETAQLIQLMPAAASQAAYIEAGILCTSQALNSLTFTATSVPAEDLTLYVAITAVDYE